MEKGLTKYIIIYCNFNLAEKNFFSEVEITIYNDI